jgi:dihydropyrimidinase
LWHAVATDELSVVSTDHCPFRFADQKTLGKDDFTKIPNGMPGIEERLSLLWSGVAAGRITANRFVELSATNPAKLFGMYPHKGTIAIGADADLVVWDPNSKHTWSASNIHGGADYTCYEGMETTGKAVHVFSRGEHVIDEAELTAAATPGRGKFVARDTFTYDGPSHWRGAATSNRKAAVR